MIKMENLTVGDLGKLITGKTPPSSIRDAFGEKYPFITPRDMDGRKWIDKTERYLSDNGLRSVYSSLIPERAVCVSCIGSDMGKAALVVHPSVTNQQINSIVVDENRHNAEYICYDLSRRQAELKLLAGGSATPILSKSLFAKVTFSAPDKETQDSIARVLSSLDDKITINRRLNETLEQMARALFQSWFVDFDPVKAKLAAKRHGRDPERACMAAISGKLRIPAGKPGAERLDDQLPTADELNAAIAALDTLTEAQRQQLAETAANFPSDFQDSELGLIPFGWKVSELGSHAKFQNGYAFKSKDWSPTGIPVVKIGSVKPGIVDLSGCSYVKKKAISGLERFELEAGDIVIGMTGYPGVTGLVPVFTLKPYLNQRVGKISTPSDAVENYPWIFAVVRDYNYKLYAEGRAHGSAQANVSGKALMEYQIVWGGQDVVKLFEAVALPMIRSILELDYQSRTLADLRDTLLPKLLSGELSVSAAKATVEETVEV